MHAYILFYVAKYSGKWELKTTYICINFGLITVWTDFIGGTEAL